MSRDLKIIGVVLVVFWVGFGLGFSTHRAPGIAMPTKKIVPTVARPKPLPKNPIIDAVNLVRHQNNLAPLNQDATLNKIASDKANDMCAKQYADHNAPDGRSWTYYFLKDGYYYKEAGENLAEGFTDPYATVNAWAVSPHHYENIVNDKYKEIGAATITCRDYRGSKNVSISVSEFGARYE